MGGWYTNDEIGRAGIRLRLFAPYRRYQPHVGQVFMPAGSQDNAYDLEVPGGTWIVDSLA